MDSEQVFKDYNLSGHSFSSISDFS